MSEWVMVHVLGFPEVTQIGAVIWSDLTGDAVMTGQVS